LQIPQAGKKVKRFVPLVNQSRFETFKFLNMRKLERNEMKNLKGGGYSGGGGGLSCEDECVLEGRSGCGTNEKCVSVTCEANTNTCYNICVPQ
jgi:hypothetical protein